MARARNIKPSLFKNEVLGVADPLLTILFTSLWCIADKKGRMEDRPLRIKAETFPYRENIDINRYLTELERLGFIHRYVVNNVGYIQVVNFDKHQNPHHTEKESEYPEYSITCDLTVNNTLNNSSSPADSGFLIPDSLNLIPDSGFQNTDEGISTKENKSNKQYSPPIGSELLADWKKHRGKNGITETVFKGFEREALKAGIPVEEAIRISIVRGWRGFNADWLIGSQYKKSKDQEWDDRMDSWLNSNPDGTPKKGTIIDGDSSHDR